MRFRFYCIGSANVPGAWSKGVRYRQQTSCKLACLLSIPDPFIFHINRVHRRFELPHQLDRRDLVGMRC